MDNNTEKRIENPYIPMAFEALRQKLPLRSMHKLARYIHLGLP